MVLSMFFEALVKAAPAWLLEVTPAAPADGQPPTACEEARRATGSAAALDVLLLADTPSAAPSDSRVAALAMGLGPISGAPSRAGRGAPRRAAAAAARAVLAAAAAIAAPDGGAAVPSRA